MTTMNTAVESTIPARMPVSYPLWLRCWHWGNAFLCLVLILTGIGLDRAEHVVLRIPSQVYLAVHNVAGILLAVFYLFFLLASLISGNWRHYLPRLQGLGSRLARQADNYLHSIPCFRRHHHEPNPGSKFNPLEQVTYLGVMALLVPVVTVTGLLLIKPGLAAGESKGGVLSLHAITGYLLAAFVGIHIYLAATGETAVQDFERMIVGEAAEKGR